MCLLITEINSMKKEHTTTKIPVDEQVVVLLIAARENLRTSL